MDHLKVQLSVEPLESGIIIYRLWSFNVASVEACMTRGLADDQLALAQGLPRCSLIDLSQAGYPNTYSMYRLGKFFKQYSPKLVGRSAGLVAHSGVMAMLPHLMNRLPARGQIDMRLFWAAQESEALAWLAECYRALQ
jgi:hypothetical protein